MTISVSIGEGAAPPARRWLTGLVLAGALVLALRALLAATSGASLHVDEAQYWDWSRHLAWGYYSKPPLVAALIAASTALFGDAEHGVRALAMLCWVLAGGVLALLARSVAAAAGRGVAGADSWRTVEQRPRRRVSGTQRSAGGELWPSDVWLGTGTDPAWAQEARGRG
jgi:hypothetical protein